jgi:hypothetical protein
MRYSARMHWLINVLSSESAHERTRMLGNPDKTKPYRWKPVNREIPAGARPIRLERCLFFREGHSQFNTGGFTAKHSSMQPDMSASDDTRILTSNIQNNLVSRSRFGGYS